MVLLSSMRIPLLLASAAFLAACDGGSDAAPVADAITVSGVAAAGAPVVNGAVALRCANGAVLEPLTTDSAGAFRIDVRSAALPCALRVSGGGLVQPLHSVTTGTGSTLRANLTPFSDLVVARALQAATGRSDVNAWFNGTPATNLDDVQAAVPAAITTWAAAFAARGNYGVALPAGFDPITRNFTATIGDPYDDMMESFNAALVLAGASLQTLRTQFAVTTAPGSVMPPPDVSGGGSGDLAPLGEMNGMKVSVGGHTWSFVGAQGDWTAPGGFRKVDFAQGEPLDGTGFNGQTGVLLGTASVVVAVQAPGMQLCGGEVALTLGTTGSGPFSGRYTATSCQIDVQYVSPRGGVAGVVIAATLANPGGQTVQIANAPFRAYRHRGPGTAATGVAANSRMSMFIDSGTFEFPQGREFQLSRDVANVGAAFGAGSSTPDGTALHSGHASDNVVLNVQYASGFFLGARTYNCGEIISGDLPINMQLWMGTYQGEYAFMSDNAGGACVLNITRKVGDYFSGSYTATLVGEPHSSTVLTTAQRTLRISGELRNFRMDRHQPDDTDGPLPPTGAGASMTVTNGNLVFDLGDAYLLASNAVDLGHAKRFGFSAHWGNSVGNLRWNNSFVRADNGFDIILRDIPHKVGVYRCGDPVDGLYPYLLLDSERVGRFNSTAGTPQTRLAGADCMITVDEWNVETGTIAGTYTATLVNDDLATMTSADATLGIAGSFRQSGLTLPIQQ